jgi:hypothetical protein
MKMEKDNSSEMSAIIHKSAQCFITEDCHTDVQGHEKLVFLTNKFVSYNLNKAIYLKNTKFQVNSDTFYWK